MILRDPSSMGNPAMFNDQITHVVPRYRGRYRFPRKNSLQKIFMCRAKFGSREIYFFEWILGNLTETVDLGLDAKNCNVQPW